MSRHLDAGQSPGPHVHLDITFDAALTLPRQIIWLLAGIAIGHLHTLGGLVAKIGHILQVITG